MLKTSDITRRAFTSVFVGLKVRDGRGLGHAEALPELDDVGGGLFHELLDERGSEGSGAAGHGFHRGQVLRFHGRVGRQEADQGRHEVQPRGLKFGVFFMQQKIRVSTEKNIF
jgi:hypothetical protein